MNWRRWTMAVAVTLLVVVVTMKVGQHYFPRGLFSAAVSLVTIIICMLLAIVLHKRIVHIVRMDEVAAIEFMGRFLDVSTTSIPVVPILETVYTLPLSEQFYQSELQTVLTRDGVETSMQLTVRYQLQTNGRSLKETVYRALYLVADWQLAVRGLVIAILHQQVGRMSVNEVLQTWTNLGAKVRATAQPIAEGWGVQIKGVSISNVHIPEGLRAALEDRQKADAEALTMEARAAGEAERIRLISEGISECGSLGGVLTERYIQALESMSANPSTRIVLPMELVHMLSSLGISQASSLENPDSAPDTERAADVKRGSPNSEKPTPDTSHSA